MESYQPNNDPKELSPQGKKLRVRYITIAVVIFLALVLLYMFFNLKPKPEELPINTNPTVAETEQQ